MLQRIDLGHTTWTTKDGTPPSANYIQAKSATFLMYCGDPGDGGNLMLSTDAGENFAATTKPTGFAYNLSFSNAGSADRTLGGRIYAAWQHGGLQDTIFYSDDSGTTWTLSKVVGNIVGSVNSLRCSPDKEAYVVAGAVASFVPADCIVISTDSGATWTEHHYPLGNDTSAAFWGYGDRIIGVGGNIQYRVWTSDDLGSSWTLRYQPPGEGLGRNMFRLGNNVLLLLSEMNPTTYQFLQRSPDNGTTWETIEPPPDVNRSSDYMQAMAYDPALDMLYVSAPGSSFHSIWQLPSPATASASAPAWAFVVNPTAVASDINGLCIIPSVSPPSGGGGGGGGPPRFGPFHPTRLQRFQRNVLPSHKPQAIG